MDYINGNNFLDIADFAIDFDHHDLKMNLFRNDAIIYCKTDFLPMLFKYIEFSGRKYILISHMSDHSINKERFLSAPKSIKKWYAENATYEHDNLISIPLGLENHKGRSKGSFTNHKWFVNNVERLRKIPKDTALYCNWNPDTNQEVRRPILEQLKDRTLVKESRMMFEDYCYSMAHHKFVVCPPGNGADTHRLWEALYLGCYPITLESNIYKDYNLPILQVKRWSDVSRDLLNEHFVKWHGKDSLDQLKMSWWSDLIKKEFLTL